MKNNNAKSAFRILINWINTKSKYDKHWENDKKKTNTLMQYTLLIQHWESTITITHRTKFRCVLISDLMIRVGLINRIDLK